MSSIAKQISKLEDQLNKLKLKASKSKEPKAAKSKKCKGKQCAIESCDKKTELAKFTKKELLDWIKNKQITLKEASKKLKADLVKFVWKHLDTDCDSDSESDSDCETDSDSDSDTDSDCDSD
jgi:hypothetical protein